LAPPLRIVQSHFCCIAHIGTSLDVADQAEVRACEKAGAQAIAKFGVKLHRPLIRIRLSVGAIIIGIQAEAALCKHQTAQISL